MPHLLLIFITLIIFPFSTSSSQNQINGRIPVGSSIVASKNSTSWLSPSGEFAFGFQQLQNMKAFFILSIWFAKIPDRTPVWFKLTTNPVPHNSTLTIDATFGIVLRDPHGNSLYNTSGLTDKVGYALMSNTGSFILSHSNTTSLWESFNSPSDTILPTQKIEINGTLISKDTETNFGYGRFYAGMNANGDFVLSTRSVFTNKDFDDEYYNSNSNSVDAALVFDESPPSISLVKNGKRIKSILSSKFKPSEYYFRATIEFDGVFVLYRFPKKFDNSSRWVSEGSLPEGNICIEINGDKGTGPCGLNSVCSLVNRRPSCNCPEGYSLVDPMNTYGHCELNFDDNCIDQDGEDEFVLKEIADVDWPFNDYQQISPCSKNDCRSACKNDDSCRAAIYRSESCWKKRLPLSNGRNDSSLGATAFLKVRKTSS